MSKGDNLFVRKSIDLHESMNWDLYAPYALFKEEYIDEESEKEIISSYVNAVNTLCNEIKKQNHSGVGVLATVRADTLTIPFMFLIRHTVELVIKHIRKGCKLPANPTHNLMKLWNEVVPIIKNMNCGFDDEVVQRITDFLSDISFVDNDGTKTRYSHDNKGNIQNRSPVFINCDNINRVIRTFSEFAKIDFGEIKNESTSQAKNCPTEKRQDPNRL